MIPYGRQCIDDNDIDTVIDTLRSPFLTTGPKVDEFERAICTYTGARHGAAVCNGTAALHACMYSLGIRPGDEVIVTPMTFAASANCILYQGGRPVFADVEEETLLLDAEEVKKKVTSKTKAIVAVDYAGQPCDYDTLREIADDHGIKLVADACHSLGGSYKGRDVGTLADLTALSFHPVKHITTGEGGMVLTDDDEFASRVRMFRNHGIDKDHRQRQTDATWHYEMVDLGYNYRLTDIQCALGISQLKKLPRWLERRKEIARRYDDAFKGSAVTPLKTYPYVSNAYHLYVVRLNTRALGIDRTTAFVRLREAGIGVNVHYIPVHLHPYYQSKVGTKPGMCPIAEAAYEQIISLPMFGSMGDEEIERVIKAVLSLER